MPVGQTIFITAATLDDSASTKNSSDFCVFTDIVQPSFSGIKKALDGPGFALAEWLSDS